MLGRWMSARSGMAALVLLAACGTDPSEAGTVRGALLESHPLDAPAQGITVAPDTGVRWALVDGDELVFQGDDGWVSDLEPLVGAEPLTDLVALGNDVFAMTGIGEGYLVDGRTGEMELFFCYLPGEDIPRDPPQEPPPVDAIELSQSVAYDPVTNLLVANPQTIGPDGRVYRSEIAWFDRETGQELEFRNLPNPEMLAGGLGVVETFGGTDLTVALGDGSMLWTVSTWEMSPLPWADLAPAGVSDISGLTVTDETIEVVDGAQDRLFVFDRGELETLR